MGAKQLTGNSCLWKQSYGIFLYCWLCLYSAVASLYTTLTSSMALFCKMLSVSDELAQYCCFCLVRWLNSLNKLEEGGKNKPHLNWAQSFKWLNEIMVKPLLFQSIIGVYFVLSLIKPIPWSTLHTYTLCCQSSMFYWKMSSDIEICINMTDELLQEVEIIFCLKSLKVICLSW